MHFFISLVAVVALLHQVMGDPAPVNQVATASNTFANSLYQEIAKEPGNVLVCPISLHVALGLLLQGAGSNTSAELASVLGFSAVNDRIKTDYKALLTGIKDDTLKVATKLYPAKDYKLSPTYVSVAQEYFLSDVEGLDYTKPTEASGTINKYVEDHTNNKIHDLISPDAITDLTRLIIINAVHFQATWKKTFSTSYDDYFKVSSTEKVLTKMMSMTSYFDYKEDPELKAKILKMDYKEGDYSMLFILPNKEDGLPELEQKLAHTDLNQLLSGLKETKVEVIIPKFKLEKKINLKDVLINMGLKDIFSSSANLSGIANGDNLYVSDVIQKTFINVHENGTEAAAATGFYIELLSASLGEMFSARWPFHFTLLRSQNPRMKLFDGIFVRPSPTIDDSEEPIRFVDNDDIDVRSESSESLPKGKKTLIRPDQEGKVERFKPSLVNNEIYTGPVSQNPLSHKQNSNRLPQTQHAINPSNKQNTREGIFHNQHHSEQRQQIANQNVNDFQPSQQQNLDNLVQTPHTTIQPVQHNTEEINIENQHHSGKKPSREPPHQRVNNYLKTQQQNLNNLSQTQGGTIQPNQQNTEESNIQNQHYSGKRPSQQPFAHQNVNNSLKTQQQNSNNLPQTQRGTIQPNQQNTEESNIQNKQPSSQKPPNLFKPVFQNVNNVPNVQHTTTQRYYKVQENRVTQNEYYFRDPQEYVTGYRARPTYWLVF